MSASTCDPAAVAALPFTVFFEEKAASVAYSTATAHDVASSPSETSATVAVAEERPTFERRSVPEGGSTVPVTNEASVFVAERPLKPVTTTLTK